MPMDAAYEAMRDENDLLRSELYKLCKKLTECELQRDYLQKKLESLRNHVWVAVNERLPTDDGKYIVAYKANRGGWKVKSVYYRDGKWIGVAYDVSHWRVCPAPPEME